ncbi:efflux pump, RND family, membrane fusion protein [Geotalea daltonii FRC-32]|uniref:Efflux pump, RND family, membrane fusion protein n=1 Tax=Geotalea daltonii (strain DSM 22248 / JCM 15807 / FRC-32) TaxID=316067 RepID=B9M4Y8_GEODF|nr:HlyD family type I secretion periplasmic adaptor subunit [Geotalea daltonii]ACM21672.1 efflux pump, RND family, membrane fusion protein [Geotalea daltonii FRC-32]
MNEQHSAKPSGLVRLSSRLFNAAETDSLDFAPSMVQLQEKPPAPLGRTVLKVVAILFCCVLLWAILGRLDIVAVAEGKLVPKTYLKIVQPSEQGIVEDILVKEGQSVTKGQLLMRMDAVLSTAEGNSLTSEFHRLRLGLRRIDAELAGRQLTRESGDPPDLFAQVSAQYHTNRQAQQSAIDEQQSVLERARQDMASAREIKAKLEQTLPHYREQERAYEDLFKTGTVAKLQFSEKQRDRIEKEHDLRTQEFTMKSNQALMAQAQKKMAQITAENRRQLQIERVESMGQFEKIRQELAKQQHRHQLLELRAPDDGVVKDLATHTTGTVVTPGTILMTLVPKEEPLQAEVWVSNEDIGFVRPNQPVKVKLSAFTFQKYGMLNGKVEQVSADSSENQGQTGTIDSTTSAPPKDLSRLRYKTLVTLSTQQLMADGQKHKLTPGMQVSAEIKLGTRSVVEYLFSPVTKAFHEAGRER